LFSYSTLCVFSSTLKGHASLAGWKSLGFHKESSMDTQAIRAQMPTLVCGHVPRNIRTFKFNIFDGQPKVSTLGSTSIPGRSRAR